MPLGFFPAWLGVGADVAGRHKRSLSSARVDADLAMIGLRSDRGQVLLSFVNAAALSPIGL